MNLSPLEQINGAVNSSQTKPNEEALRNAAKQFEAILLMKLTSVLNSSGEDEDSLFGNDGGTSLAKQLFSEQLATTMAESGGIGLANVIMRQLGGKSADLSKDTNLSKPIAAVKDIRTNEAENVLTKESNDEIGVVWSFEDDIKQNGVDEYTNLMMLDGKILNTTRPRVVPNQPVTVITPNSVPGETNPAKNPENVQYNLPVEGRISSKFGNRFHPIDKKTKFHGGIDIAVPRGTQVGSAAEGVVKFAGWKGGYGNYVVIQHPDGKETSYGHLDKIFVSVGDEVSSGQPIAASGSTGKSTGPHLHFEVRQNGELLNPLKILSNVLRKNADL